MSVIHWTEIESFHNIRKFTKAYPENLKGQPVVTYRAKVKLHGTNAGVQVHKNGSVIPQSRTTELTDGNDNAGFAKWVLTTLMAPNQGWKAAAGHIIFGEWCGPGVQKGVAISEIPRKVFVVFAARTLQEPSGPDADARCYTLPDGSCTAKSCMHTNFDTLITEPEELKALVAGVPDTYVLPWHGEEVNVNWADSAEDLQKNVDLINQSVIAVETNDPWVEATFGVKGTGEGLVFYPVSKEHLGNTNFTNLVFKAKGEKHKNIKAAAPAQVDATIAANVDQFVDMVLTDARLEQGVGAIAAAGSLSFDMKLVGKFLAWIDADVQKETQDELEASGLEWKQVQKPIATRARTWYIAQAKKL